MRPGPLRSLSAVTAALTVLLVAVSTAAAKPLVQIRTSPTICPLTATTWSVAYQSFGSVAFTPLRGAVARQASPDGGRPGPGLDAALQQTANLFGSASHCAVRLRFDVYWAPRKRLAVAQEPYDQLVASKLPRPLPLSGGPLRASQFYSRYDSVMQQFYAVAPSGETLLGPDFQGETFGYVSLIDATVPVPGVLEYELLQGMYRFYVTRGARFAPDPDTGMDAYCSSLRTLGYTDLVQVGTQVAAKTCTSDAYAHDVIAGTVPRYKGITHTLWRSYSPSRSYRRHGTLPAGLPVGYGRISSGAGPY